jgi:tetratricopeptide (TPR) repeat protein
LNAPIPPARLARRAEALVDAGRPAQALALADEAIRREAGAEGYAARARALRALGDAEGALAALDALVARAPRSAPAHDARGVLLAEAGRLAEARVAYERALLLDPALARAHFGLASLGGTTPERLAAMEALAADPTPQDPGQRLFLLYALVRAYDEAGDFARAFAAAEAGARLRSMFWTGDEAEGLRRLAEAGPETRAGAEGDPTEAPIFVLAMPRSGTTLVEQILASHPEVAALGETERLAALAGRVRDPAGLSAAYLAHWPSQAGAARRVVDKSLGNFLHIGAIRRAFPRAKLVHVRRDALDCALSIHFSLLFGEMPFPPGLAGLGRYYRGYRQLMAAWRAALPGDVLYEISYERLAADLEGETRALLAFCGLAFDPRCLAFHETKRRVATASLAQVRRPLYLSAVGRSRNYEAWLAPLRETLGKESRVEA